MIRNIPGHYFIILLQWIFLLVTSVFMVEAIGQHQIQWVMYSFPFLIIGGGLTAIDFNNSDIE